MTAPEIHAANRQAIYLTLPSAVVAAVFCSALLLGRSLPLWAAFICLLAVFASIDGIPAIWRSAFPFPTKLLLTASHVIGDGFVLVPLLSIALWSIGGVFEHHPPR